MFQLTSPLGAPDTSDRYLRTHTKARRLEHGLEFVLLDCRDEYLAKYLYRTKPIDEHEHEHALSNALGVVEFVRCMDTQDIALLEQLLDCLLEYLEPEPLRPNPLGLWLMPDEAWLLIADALSPVVSPEFYNGVLGLGNDLPLDE